MERRLRKQVRDREKLAALSPGGAPERPVRVATVAVIEGRAKAEPCPLCDGAVELLDHAAVEREGAALRELTVRCRRCHVSRSRWFAIAPPLAN